MKTELHYNYIKNLFSLDVCLNMSSSAIHYAWFSTSVCIFLVLVFVFFSLSFSLLLFLDIYFQV